MALKDLSTSKAADILVQLAPLMDNITSDKALMEKVGQSMNKDGMTKVGMAIEALHRVFSCVPLLFVNHRSDIFGIIAAVKRKDVEEIAAQSIIQTKNDLQEIIEDKDLRDFFAMFNF